MDPIIAQDITRLYRNRLGVKNISISVKTGRCLGVLGSNGSGKTTLTRLVAGLDRVGKGSLSVLGENTFPRPSYLRRRCGVSLDTPAHWDTLSGRQNLWFFARQFGLSGSVLRRRVDELLSEAELKKQADQPVSVYSFGMRRKLSIIEAMVHDPDLLILDEPSAGADMAFLDRLVNWIHNRCKRGKTTWVADNDADWLQRAATNVVLLCDGRIRAEGTVSHLMSSVSARNRISIQLEQSGFNAKPSIDGIVEFRCEGSQITADVKGNSEIPVKLLNWINASGGHVREMKISSFTLYQALMQLAEQKETTS